MRTSALTLALALSALACAHPATGSERLSLPQTLAVQASGGDFTVEYQPQDAREARQVAAALQESVARASRWGSFAVPVTITIHPSHEALEAAARKDGFPWMRAWARYASVDLQSPRTWSRGFATDDQVVEILAHELTHCLLYQATRDPVGFGRRGIPLWFREGMAIATSGEQQHASPTPPIVRAAGGGQAGPSLRGLAYGREASGAVRTYDRAHQAFELLLERHGEQSVRAILSALSRGLSFDAAFQEATGLPVGEFEASAAIKA